MELSGVIHDVMNIADIMDNIKVIHDRAKHLDKEGQYCSIHSMLNDISKYGDDLCAYSTFNPSHHFLYRSIERNVLLLDIKAYRITFNYIGSRGWFIHFLKSVGLYEWFGKAEIKNYESDDNLGFITEPHHYPVETFSGLNLSDQRSVVRSLVTLATTRGETGDMICYGSYRSTEDEQKVGWFVTASKHLSGDENAVVKHYFNSKENNIRLSSLKEYIALCKSVNRVLRHI